MRGYLAAFAVLYLVPLSQAQGPVKLLQVSGSVINSATSEPVSKALVILKTNISQGRAVTGPDGKFFLSVPDGPAGNELRASKELRVSHAGYRSESGQDVASQSIMTDGADPVTVKLVPLAVLEGRVVNADGEPLPSLTVEAIQARIREGRRELRSYARKTTDDRGVYRLWDLSPGSYYLKVAGKRGTTIAVVNMAPGDFDDAYGPVYYPSASTSEAAQVLQLLPGETIHADFKVEGRSTHRIRGSFKDSKFAGEYIQLLRRNDPIGNRVTINRVAGTFEVFDVTPGSYTLQAYSMDSGPIRMAEVAVTVQDRDLAGITLTMNPAVDVQVEVETDPEDKSDSFIRVSANPVSWGRLPPSISVKTWTAQKDGENHYVLKDLLPGPYDFSVVVDGQRHVVSITSGGDDVLKNGLTIGSAAPPPVKIRLAKGSATIHGKFVEHGPNDSVTVAIVPKLSGLISVVNAYTGEFSADGLAPGEYSVYAWPSSRAVEYRNPEALAALASKAVTVSLQVGDDKEVTLKVVPGEPK
jgi:hypothetical protein